MGIGIQRRPPSNMIVSKFFMLASCLDDIRFLRVKSLLAVNVDESKFPENVVLGSRSLLYGLCGIRCVIVLR